MVLRGEEHPALATTSPQAAPGRVSVPVVLLQNFKFLRLWESPNSHANLQAPDDARVELNRELKKPLTN